MLVAPEDPPNALARVVPLARPAMGAASRVRLGRAELVLEHTRGGYSLLWSDGREARRYVLGLGDRGQLSVELRAPRLPLRIALRELVTIVPGARLRGYLHVPLVPTVVWRDRLDHAQALLELLPPQLQGTWEEGLGTSFRCSASWLVRFPYQSGEPVAVLPIRLYNVGEAPASPAELPLTVRDDELHSLRGALVLAPRRLVWHGDELRTEGDS